MIRFTMKKNSLRLAMGAFCLSLFLAGPGTAASVWQEKADAASGGAKAVTPVVGGDQGGKKAATQDREKHPSSLQTRATARFRELEASMKRLAKLLGSGPEKGKSRQLKLGLRLVR